VINTLFNKDKILSRSRQPWVDYIRGMCILMVVYRHVHEGLDTVGVRSSSYPLLEWINMFFFNFRMPLFFIVSGIFLSGALARKSAGGYVNDRFRTIFYPLMIWGSIQITLQLLFTGYVHVQREPVDYLNLLIAPRHVEQFWYLNALFFVSTLYALVSWYAKFKPMQQLMLGVLFYIISSYCLVNKIHIGFLQDTLFFYVFFAIGDLLTDLILNQKNYKTWSSYKTTLILLPFFLVGQTYFAYLNLLHHEDYFVQYQRPILFAATSVVGCAFFINLAFLMQKSGKLRIFRVIGYHSLWIYVMHLIVTAGLRIVLVRFFGIEDIPVLMVISIVAGVAIPIMSYNLAMQLGWWWLFTLKKPEGSTVPRRAVSSPNLYFSNNVVVPKESTNAAKNNSENTVTTGNYGPEQRPSI
jgi:fucose 4-O-acetylase-like acetyltransferase